MRFSIVVPTYNEENDIQVTLEHLVALDWPDFEVLIVDESTDKTPDIVRAFAGQGVRLIRPLKKEGRCGARNLGILESSGEVVIILNADVRLPKNFIALIEHHYKEGADYVLVRAVVENINDLFARYVECIGIHTYYGDDAKPMEWTEGFSCRRQIAIDAGLFPIGYPVPICAGEDGFFGDKLRKLGANKITDLNIVCTHIAPTTLAEYWYIRKGRGQGSPQVKRFLQGWGYNRIILYAALRTARLMLICITLVPVALIVHRYVKKSPRGLADFFPFCWAWLVEQLAFLIGEWQSIIEISKAEVL